jgi:hypothetical protein
MSKIINFLLSSHCLDDDLRLKKLETNYLPAERDDPDVVGCKLIQVAIDDIAQEILKSDTMALILNERRQIIYANEAFMEFAGFVSLESIIGQRIGRIFRCMHLDGKARGCGTYEPCRSCHMAQAFDQYSQTGDPQDGLYRVPGKHSIVGDAPVKFTLKPASVDGVNYLVVTLCVQDKTGGIEEILALVNDRMS